MNDPEAVSVDPIATTSSIFPSLGVAAGSIAGAWSLYVAFIAVRLKITSFPRLLLLLERHLLVAWVGAGLTWLLYLVIRRLRRASILQRAATALVLAVPAAMTIAATAVGDRLDLLVEDDGRARQVGTGAGSGLHNGASRLAARYGTAARCSDSARPDGGFRIELALPLRAPLATA